MLKTKPKIVATIQRAHTVTVNTDNMVVFTVTFSLFILPPINLIIQSQDNPVGIIIIMIPL